ncbi:hypothetical protein HYS31_04660 [Candidatus Woesearchaeota archaeon]|nr:hypothetical protein [Candidatus Woesearchaeota archaeon]
MRIALLFPIRNYEKKIPDITLELSNKIHKDLTILGANHIDVRFPGLDYSYVATNQSKEISPKGRMILDALNNMPQPPNFVIICDGSGKIPYSYISEIFQELISDSNLSCVMAHRIKHKAIDSFRYLIERFEVFSLMRYHNYPNKIPDGQCGLWAFRYGKLDSNGKEISLTSEGYEIELDLLDEVINKKLNFSFIEVDLPVQPITTSYTYEDNFEKLKFLCSKCNKLKDCLTEYLIEFESTNEFKGIIKNMDENEVKMWENKYKVGLNNFIKSSE